MPRAGVAGGALGALTFCVTVSILAALPIWDAGWGGWPALNGVGSFLIKDVALLGISLVVLGESAGRPATVNRDAAGVTRNHCCLRLDDRRPRGRLRPSTIHETMRLQIVLTVLADVDAEVEEWLRQAYEENS